MDRTPSSSVHGYQGSLARSRIERPYHGVYWEEKLMQALEEWMTLSCLLRKSIEV
jgi:hypothetical protein